jgi:hypothetical protein
MTYYLLSEENQYTIYLVHKRNRSYFMQQHGDKIMLNACNIVKLLQLFNKGNSGVFTFSKN